MPWPSWASQDWYSLIEMKDAYLDKSPRDLYDLGVILRQQCNFGEAINAFRAAAQAPYADEEIKRKSLASIELMQEINGFVNTDLMNP